MDRRVWIGALGLALLPTVIVLVSIDAAARRKTRSSEQAKVDKALTRLPTSDLALSGGARWLRSLSVEEPAAAFADAPAIPDPDPAGGMVAPPAEVWALEPGVRPLRVVHGGAR